MKKILAFLFLMFGFAQAASAGIDGGKAVEMVENLTREGIEKIINSNASPTEKNKVFKQLFTENLDWILSENMCLAAIGGLLRQSSRRSS